MSLKTFKITMGILGGILALFAIAIAVLAWRSEDTRNVVEKIDSSCARAHDRTLSKQARAIAIDECAKNVCVALRDVMTVAAFEDWTRCPGRGVVTQSSPTASQPSGPGDPGFTVTDGNPSAPSDPSPDSPDRPDPPSTPSEPPPPSSPEPRVPEPTSPPPPAPTRPLIDLTPVTDPVCSGLRPIAAVC